VTNLFISYRRDDAAGHAGRLSDRLIASFGADRIFMDVQDIEPGQNFQQAIEKTLARCDYLIAVIGPRWLEIMQARKANGEDFVRHEISVALALGKTVIPVLVGGARLPAGRQLPAEMAAFVLRQAVEIRDSCFDEDAGRLLAFLAHGFMPATTRPRGLGTRRNLLLTLTGALTAAAIGAWLLWPKTETSEQPLVEKAAAAIDINGDWVAELQRSGQRPFKIRLTFVVMGGQVVGSVQYPTGEGAILDGRYADGQMTFSTSHVPSFETQPVTINFQARVEGDLIRLTIAYADGVATGVAHRVARQGR
jgi:TIR domain